MPNVLTGFLEGTALFVLVLACWGWLRSERERRRMIEHLGALPRRPVGPLEDVIEGNRACLERLPAELSARARYLEEIIRSEPECVKTLDADGRLLEMNPAGLRLIEADSFESVEGADVLDLVQPEWKEAFLEMHRAVIAGESRTLIFRLAALKGTSRWMETHAVPFVHDDGRVLHLAITRDITERKHKEQELIEAKEMSEAANRAKSEFLANMSHELRTPLTAILGYAELLDDSRRSPEDLKEGIATIQDSGRHLLGLISNVLDMTKIEASRHQLELIPCDLGALARMVVETLRVQADSAGIELLAETPEKPLLVRTDPTSLRQILINLVGNAVKFTEEGSVQVRLTASPCDAGLRVLLSVRDTGMGMDAATLKRVFDPFAQADNSTRRRFGGTGLGLSISQRLAELMGGQLDAESEPGAGCTFTLSMHMEEVSPEELESTGDKRGAGSEVTPIAGHVLLVEDLAVNRKVIGKMLERLGLEVHEAEDGLAGLRKALKGTPEGEPFDVVLMDMHMPVMDGFEASSRLRDACFGGRVIALTADAMSEDRKRCLASGCDDYLSKPVSMEALRDMLQRHLKLPGHDRSSRSA